jgi:hypothetical protein
VVQELVNAGMPPISTVGEPGFQGVVTGMHGIGVSTPRAAAVAAATIGLANELHIPNGGMFTIGIESIMFAAGAVASTRLFGSTFNTAGAKPKLHLSIAPVTTWTAICQ